MMGNRNRKEGDTRNRVSRKKLTACMTCPLCSELFIDATTISECLHTFCRRCIHKTIIEEGLNHCPVCITQLGCSPSEKLRPDHNMQYLVTNVFGIENPVHENIVGEESEESLGQISRRRKEKLISSLVEGSITATATSIEKRAKYTRRRDDAEAPEASESADRPKNTATEIEKGDMWKPLSSLQEHDTNKTTRKTDEKSRPVWFSLIASEHKEGAEPLPQLSCRYIRVKDRSMPVTVIQKYLVQKLGLESESEVEIWLQDERVETSSELHAVIERWLRRTSSSSSRTHKERVGASAKEFVMVLSYARKT